MHPNQELIVNFYEAFQQRDFVTMQRSYDEDAVFSDAIFKSLDAKQVRMMWEMLVLRGKDLEIFFSDVIADEIKGSAKWQATYTFSRSGRKVRNNIAAAFIFHEGKIIQHTDRFDFYTWARQAFGLTGFLLGGTKFFHEKVKTEAMLGLERFILKKSSIS